MAASVNRVFLIGNLGKDPEVRNTQSGARIASFNVATSESWTDRASGERKERTEWHRVVVYNDHLVDIAEKYLRKGSKVWIEGGLQTRKWTDQAGVERYTTEVVLGPYKSTLTILDGGRDRREDDGPADHSAGHGRTTSRTDTRPGMSGAARTASTGLGYDPSNNTATGQRWDSGRGNGNLRGGDLDDEIPF